MGLLGDPCLYLQPGGRWRFLPTTLPLESIPDGCALLSWAQAPASSFDMLFANTRVQHTAWAFCVSGLVWSAAAVSRVAGTSRTAEPQAQSCL